VSLKIGIVGLPNSGKSTLFNALLQRQIADVAEYPFTTIEPNVGVVQVPDERLQAISQATGIKKIVPAAIEFIDIAGLVKGAHEGEGLGNKFLGHIREVDAILHLVRGFRNPNIQGEVNPEEDIKTINEELKQAEIAKPAIYVLNVDEKELGSEVARQQFGSAPTAPLVISAKLESELSELSEEDCKAYLKELGLKESALDRVIKECYKLLGLVTFFTIAGGKQVQAWPLRTGNTSLAASGVLHTDMQKGFIKAEVVSYELLVQSESWQKAKEKGLVRFEGKDYKVQDGDVVEFKFNV